MTRGLGVARIIAARAQNGTYQRDADPTSLDMILLVISRSQLKSFLGCLAYGFPQLAHEYPLHSACFTHSLLPPICDWLPVCTPEDGVSKALRTASEHACTCTEN